jgi:hypothetical protein
VAGVESRILVKIRSVGNLGFCWCLFNFFVDGLAFGERCEKDLVNIMLIEAFSYGERVLVEPGLISNEYEDIGRWDMYCSQCDSTSHTTFCASAPE